MRSDRLRGNRCALSRSTLLRGFGGAAVIAAQPMRLSDVNDLPPSEGAVISGLRPAIKGDFGLVDGHGCGHVSGL